MMLLNFSHPLTPDQQAQIEHLTSQTLEQVVELFTHFDLDQPFGPQVDALLAPLPLTAADWQTQAILVNPPSYNYITAYVLAELHGRMGYFPPLVRLKPVAGAVPPRYEVAEVMNLQAVRDAARGKRGK
jgi:hypothetical protein